MHVRRAALAFTFAIAFASAAVAQTAAQRFEAVRRDPLRLRQFLEAMPKGGDLHHHLSGAVYAETLLRLSANDNLCIDTKQLSIVAVPKDATECKGDNIAPAASVFRSGALYQQMLDALSMRQFRAVDESGHDHFFNTFSKMGPVTRTHVPELMSEIVHRFAEENVDYLETIMRPDVGAAARLGESLPKGADFPTMRDQLVRSTAFADVLANARKLLDASDAQIRTDLHCDSDKPLAGCNSDVRYLFEVHRAFAREQLFAELVTAFELASIEPRVVGLNPVQPEDSYASMANFDEMMRMFAFLRPLYPKVRITVHAGELVEGLVPPEGLRYHIRDSVEIAKAERIGHGVDIARERDSASLLRDMAKRHIAVEICLTSNDVILGVRGKDHPLPMYLRAGVPTVLASDDPGVSRVDLTADFVRAAQDFNLSYADLKRMARNSIEYSFLEGRSLFANHDYATKAAECRTAGARCDAFLAANAKARVQAKLEARFRAFEK